MSDTRDLLARTAELSADFLESLDARPVLPDVDHDALRVAIARPLQDGPIEPGEVLEQLVADADPGIAGMPGGRWFGFVLGGSLPAALAADWMTSAWDQNAGLFAPAPAAAIAEDVAGEWLRQLLGLPEGVSFGFVTGCQMAHVTALAAAREHVMRERGWELGERGLYGAPPVRVVVGAKGHVTVGRALRLLGMGAPDVVRADDQGRMVVDELELDDRPTIVCAQVGEVNTGACDDVVAIGARAREAGAWLHVDGAFGLWAAASESKKSLVSGIELADSWAVDGHKWLNVPYDTGYVLCADREAHAASMSYTAAYLEGQGSGSTRAPSDYVPESSRRARGFASWAALCELGQRGLAELVDGCCALARRVGEQLGAIDGVEIGNDIVLNQVLVSFGSDERTDRVIAGVQRDGTCWMGGTTWRGRRFMRISVSNWSTTEGDVDRSVAAIRRVLAETV